MNHIIKQLAEQAGLNVKTNISGVPLVFGTFEGYKTSHIATEELEKFAELVIKKCAEVGSYYGGNVKHLIMKHFGVEE